MVRFLLIGCYSYVGSKRYTIESKNGFCFLEIREQQQQQQQQQQQRQQRRRESEGHLSS